MIYLFTDMLEHHCQGQQQLQPDMNSIQMNNSCAPTTTFKATAGSTAAATATATAPTVLRKHIR